MNRSGEGSHCETPRQVDDILLFYPIKIQAMLLLSFLGLSLPDTTLPQPGVQTGSSQSIFHFVLGQDSSLLPTSRSKVLNLLQKLVLSN
jgi:hypothetical protein